jgi:hypothetical protein
VSGVARAQRKRRRTANSHSSKSEGGRQNHPKMPVDGAALGVSRVRNLV